MQLRIAATLLGASAAVVGVICIPSRPRDYFGSMGAKVHVDSVSYGKEKNKKTGEWLYFRSEAVTVSGISQQSFQAKLDDAGVQNIGTMIVGNYVHMCSGRNVTLNYSVVTIPSEDPRTSIQADFRQDLTPREVLWVKLANWGRDPFVQAPVKFRDPPFRGFIDPV